MQLLITLDGRKPIMVFDWGLGLFSTVATLILYLLGWILVVVQSPIRAIEKEDNFSGAIMVGAIAVWVGAAACAKLAFLSTGFIVYATVGDISMLTAMFWLIGYIIGVLQDRRKRRVTGQAQKHFMLHPSKAFWQLTSWLATMRAMTPSNPPANAQNVQPTTVPIPAVPPPNPPKQPTANS